MKDLFKPVDYSSDEKTESFPVVKGPDPDEIKKEMSLFHAEVVALMNDIERGHSSLRGPMQIKGSPIFVVIERMNSVPNKENIRTFFEIAVQDIGAKFKLACEESFKKFPNLNKVIK